MLSGSTPNPSPRHPRRPLSPPVPPRVPPRASSQGRSRPVYLESLWEGELLLSTWDPRELDRLQGNPDLPPAGKLVILVDDVRAFRDGRACRIAQTADRAIALIRAARVEQVAIGQVWLDYDLLGGTTSQPVVDHLVGCAVAGSPVPIDEIVVHSSRVGECLRITQELRAAGYRVCRSYAAGIWTRQAGSL